MIVIDTGWMHIIAVLTRVVGSASKRSLVVVVTVLGSSSLFRRQRRRNKELDEVCTAIPGDEVARNK
jgi:hypothetical protein